ncbi:hypothetical protein ABZP36_008652 [Zizania latifolia]
MGKTKHKEAEAVARLERGLDEASTLRKEAEAALRLERDGHPDEAIARAEELVAKHPESALVVHLAALLHHNAINRSLDASDNPSTSKHLAAARDFYIQANRLAPNCVEIATNLAMLRFVCIKDNEADREILRAVSILFPTDPAENNVAYDLDGSGSTSKERVENAKKVTANRHRQIVSYVCRKVIPRSVCDVLDIAEREGAAKGLKAAKALAERYDYSVRAGLTHVYMNLEFVRGLAPNIDKRPFLYRVIADVNNLSHQFDTSLVVALFRAKLFFVQRMYDLVEFECDRSIGIEEPADPGDEDVPPGSVAGEKPQDRETSVREEFVRLRRKLVSMSKDYWCSLTTEKQDSFAFVRLNSMLQYYLDTFEETHSAAKIISDALSFVKKNRSWRFWICPYCVGKKIPDTGSLLQHMRNKHPEGNVWPKLLSVLGPKLCDDAFKGDYFMDDVALCQDAEEHYSLHFKRIDHVFSYLLILASKGYEAQSFSEIREIKCTEGIEILEKIKFNEACPEIQELWHDFLEISVLDYRYVISPHAISFFWVCLYLEFLVYVIAANVDAICHDIGDAPDSNAVDIDATCPNVGAPPDSNSANVDTMCSNIGDAPENNAANVEAICSNIGDAPNSNAAYIDATCPNVDAICLNIDDAPESNAAVIDAVSPNVGDALDNNAASIDALCLDIDDTPESNAADIDAICPNVGDIPDSNASNIDALCLNMANATDHNPADVPDRNSDIEHESYPSYANRDKKDEVNQKQENIMPSCSDDTLKTDGEDEESEVHAEDENSSTTVNEKYSDSPTDMVEYRNKLDATPEKVEADLKYEGTSLPSSSEQIYTTENTASLLLGNFDQSAAETASISCYQKTVDVLRMNNADEDLYFLNVTIQLLWNLVHFRNKFLRILSPFDTRHQDPCIAEKLYKIFSAWEKNEHSEMALLLTDVKTTLCEIVNDSNIFQKLQVGRNFASEIMAIILEDLHKYETSVFFGSEIVVIGSPCRYRIYYAVDLFGIKLKQLMCCKCGEWFGEEYILFFHKLDASSPHTTKINSFEELPMLIDSQSTCERRCKKCCGSVRQIDCFLSKGPHFFTIVLKDWLRGDEKQAILSEALFGIASPLDITFLYKGVTRPHICGHSATNYRLTSVICYIEHRYVCFARDQDKWLKYDTMTVKAVDSWGEILELYREINIQPEVLIYEVIK